MAMRVLIAVAALIAIAAPAAAAQAPDGKALFEANCRKCHGNGQPVPAIKKMFPEIPKWDAEFFGKRTEDSIVTILTNGKGAHMKSFKQVLKPEEMTAVARYIRTLKP